MLEAVKGDVLVDLVGIDPQIRLRLRAHDLGNAFELNDGEVPPELEDRARLIVDNCPEFAILITEE